MVRNTYKWRERENSMPPQHTFCKIDEPQPTKELQNVTNYCRSKRKHLIIGCDIQAHPIVWDAVTINP
jgi:hypothetical protein